jgi:hypothetical protein
MQIKDTSGTEVAVATIRGGLLTSDINFDDYGIKAGEFYKIHYADYIGPYFFADGEIRMNNGEIRSEMWAHLTYQK